MGEFVTLVTGYNALLVQSWSKIIAHTKYTSLKDHATYGALNICYKIMNFSCDDIDWWDFFRGDGNCSRKMGRRSRWRTDSAMCTTGVIWPPISTKAVVSFQSEKSALWAIRATEAKTHLEPQNFVEKLVFDISLIYNGWPEATSGIRGVGGWPLSSSWSFFFF